MEGFILIAVVAVLVIVLNNLSQPKITKVPCPPHRWASVELDLADGTKYKGLQCQTCKKTPQQF